MIFKHQVLPGRIAGTRTGWNDAAWGRPHRQVESAMAQWYESGYAGGIVFREKQQADLSERDVISRPLPRRAPAA